MRKEMHLELQQHVDQKKIDCKIFWWMNEWMNLFYLFIDIVEHLLVPSS